MSNDGSHSQNGSGTIKRAATARIIQIVPAEVYGRELSLGVIRIIHSGPYDIRSTARTQSIHPVARTSSGLPITGLGHSAAFHEAEQDLKAGC
jgi:hypothetical protein